MYPISKNLAPGSSALVTFRIKAKAFGFWLKSANAPLRSPPWHESLMPSNRHTQKSEITEAKKGSWILPPALLEEIW